MSLIGQRSLARTARQPLTICRAYRLQRGFGNSMFLAATTPIVAQNILLTCSHQVFKKDTIKPPFGRLLCPLMLLCEHKGIIGVTKFHTMIRPIQHEPSIISGKLSLATDINRDSSRYEASEALITAITCGNWGWTKPALGGKNDNQGKMNSWCAAGHSPFTNN